jgi:hypothetical protein
MEPVGPRDVVVLVLDAHSGAPLPGSRALIADAGLAPAADSSGRIRIHALTEGSHSLRVLAIGHDPWQTSIKVTDAAGLALVVQLRRSTRPLKSVVAGTEPPTQLPNER